MLKHLSIEMLSSFWGRSAAYKYVDMGYLFEGYTLIGKINVFDFNTFSDEHELE